jgi:hypothetical protein
MLSFEKSIMSPQSFSEFIQRIMMIPIKFYDNMND